MSRNLRLSLLIFLLVCSAFLLPHGLFAQSIWLDRTHDKTISLEILKPDFAWDANTTFATSALFFSGRFPATHTISVVGEIPFSHFGRESDFDSDETDNAIGNPYLGIETHAEGSPVFGEFGFRFPLAPEDDGEDAAFAGLLTEFVDRAEAFVIDAFPISGALNYKSKKPTGFVVRFRGGGTVWIAPGDRDESELFLLYSAQAGYESPEVNFLAGFSGRCLLSEEDIDIAERTFHHLGLAINLTFGSLRPGISLRIPIDEDMTDILDSVFGLSLLINLD
jgi:hypothetical protein